MPISHMTNCDSSEFKYSDIWSIYECTFVIDSYQYCKVVFAANATYCNEIGWGIIYLYGTNHRILVYAIIDICMINLEWHQVDVRHVNVDLINKNEKFLANHKFLTKISHFIIRKWVATERYSGTQKCSGSTTTPSSCKISTRWSYKKTTTHFWRRRGVSCSYICWG